MDADTITFDDDSPFAGLNGVAAILALDRSYRSVDSDGHLHVENCNISRANVCGYLGSEIPNYGELNLDASRVYQLYRDAAELEAAAPTYERKPLLMKHVAVSATDPQQMLTVGTISNVRFSHPFLVADLTIWNDEAIKLVESGRQRELSCGYRYVCDLTPGEIDGVKFDGRMKNLECNHVALVEVGRAGSDVRVNDSVPQEIIDMKRSALLASLSPFMKADADLIAADAALVALIAADRKAKDEEETEEEKAKRLAAEKKADDEDMPDAEDEEDDTPKAGKPKGADKAKGMDEAGVAKIVGDALAANNALHAARRDVETVIGVTAYDSASATYKAALDKLGVDVAGVHESAYGAMLKMAKDSAAARVTAAPAMDSAATVDTAKRFPMLARIK